MRRSRWVRPAVEAGRDTYTPAEDASSNCSRPSIAYDVHADMLTAGGARLLLTAGAVTVPSHMRKSLLRQRTASILCNGLADYPLLTIFDCYVTAGR